jgi:hypothetical protein
VNLNGRATSRVDISTGKDVRSEIKLRVTTGDIKIAEASSESGSDGGNPSR